MDVLEASVFRQNRLRRRRAERDARHLAVVREAADASAFDDAVSRHPAGRSLSATPPPRRPGRRLDALLEGSAVEDPLTGLATAAYLQVRLGEVYREAAVLGVPAGDLRALVVLDLTGPTLDAWEPAARVIEAAAVLRLVWPGGETMVALSGHRVAVLASQSPRLVELAEGAAELIESSVRRASDGESEVRVVLHIIQLPERPEAARAAVVRLSA